MTNMDVLKVVTAAKIISKGNIAFGTSGARGLVVDFTPSVCAAFTCGFLSTQPQKSVVIGIDNRPSSPLIAAYCIVAAQNLGFKVEYSGVLPTPALAAYAMSKKVPCIMITGSHIPFDRNGIKFYRAEGEISKLDEQAILTSTVELNAQILDTLNTVNESCLPCVSTTACEHYIARYTRLFSSDTLKNQRIGIYEHSSAGRDLYSEIFETLGATTVSLGRSDEFVPIDTEAVAQSDIDQAKRWLIEYNLDAVFSTDGDGDRPLLSDESGEYLRGDILGLLAAKALGIDALALPVSCNTSVESSHAIRQVVRTRIGSPYVIEAFKSLSESSNAVAGFEANGGFLLASKLTINGQSLAALPTRDAVLPVIAVLAATKEHGTVSRQVSRLPQRFTASDRLQGVNKVFSNALIAKALKDQDAFLNELNLCELSVIDVDQTDGLRILLSDDSYLHLRSSGNAPELRCYVESDNKILSKQRVEQVLDIIKTLTN